MSEKCEMECKYDNYHAHAREIRTCYFQNSKYLSENNRFLFGNSLSRMDVRI